MTEALNNYALAFEAHVKAQREEAVSKDKVRKTRHALLMARDELRSIERETLEANLLNL